MSATHPETLRSYGYISTGELDMYYQLHGPESGSPLLMLHGGLTTIESSFQTIIPHLAHTRQVIAVEQQGHGRTADIDRPLNFRNMVRDTAVLIQDIGFTDVDVFGYSDGGNVALGLAIEYPSLVRRLAIAGTNASPDGLEPEVRAMFTTIDANQMPDELRDAYRAVAPEPEDWTTLVNKVMQMGQKHPDWSIEELASIKQPTLLITGDRDIVRPEHAVETFRVLPSAQLAILPNTDHGLELESPETLLHLLFRFFEIELEHSPVGSPRAGAV